MKHEALLKIVYEIALQFIRLEEWMAWNMKLHQLKKKKEWRSEYKVKLHYKWIK